MQQIGKWHLEKIQVYKNSYVQLSCTSFELYVIDCNLIFYYYWKKECSYVTHSLLIKIAGTRFYTKTPIDKKAKKSAQRL